MFRAASVTLALTQLIAIVLPGASIALAASVQRAAVAPLLEVRLLDLPSVARSFNTFARTQRSMNDGEQAAAWTEFALLAQAVIGDTPLGPLTPGDLQSSIAAQGPLVRASPGVAARDRVAYQLESLGYSARETADVVSERISLAALDTALKMLLVGRSKEEAANYLDSQYKQVAALRYPQPSPGSRPAQ